MINSVKRKNILLFEKQFISKMSRPGPSTKRLTLCAHRKSRKRLASDRAKLLRLRKLIAKKQAELGIRVELDDRIEPEVQLKDTPEIICDQQENQDDKTNPCDTKSHERSDTSFKSQEPEKKNPEMNASPQSQRIVNNDIIGEEIQVGDRHIVYLLETRKDT